MITLTEVGTVKSKFKEKKDPFEMRKHESRIILNSKYSEGLYRLSECSYIQIVFGFHLSSGYSLIGPVYTGETKGVFASRSPNRPSPLGVTTVKLLGINQNELKVIGLDAVDGSPVFDIKPHVSIFDEPGKDTIKKEWNYTDPRNEMIQLVKTNNLEACLLKAGAFHGHFCPGLSSGVYASVNGMKKLSVFFSDGMENLIAITETNNCFVDGIQAVTGCTFGNNSLIYYDIGKTAVTFVLRGKEMGVRIRMKPDFHEILSERYPEFSALFNKVVKERVGTEEDMDAFKIKGREASFGLFSIPFDSLFDCTEVEIKKLAYAPILNSITCENCGEQFMASKAVRRGNAVFCKQCSNTSLSILTGEGITLEQDLD